MSAIVSEEAVNDITEQYTGFSVQDDILEIPDSIEYDDLRSQMTDVFYNKMTTDFNRTDHASLYHVAECIYMEWLSAIKNYDNEIILN